MKVWNYLRVRIPCSANDTCWLTALCNTKFRSWLCLLGCFAMALGGRPLAVSGLGTRPFAVSGLHRLPASILARDPRHECSQPQLLLLLLRQRLLSLQVVSPSSRGCERLACTVWQIKSLDQGSLNSSEGKFYPFSEES